MFFVYHFIFWYLSFSLHEFSQPACLFFFIQSARQRRPKFGEVAGDSSGPDTVGFLVGQDGQYMAMELVSKWPNDLFHSEIAMYTSNIYIYICIYVLTLQQAATSEALVSKIPWFPVQSKAHVYQATFSSDGQKAGLRPVFVTICVLQNWHGTFLKNMGIYHMMYRK